MPALDDLWTAVSKGQANEENFKKIEDILKKNPELVNSVKPGISKNPIPLLRALIAKNYPDSSLQKIITLTSGQSIPARPLIDYNFKENDPSQGTQRETLIRHSSSDLTKVAIKNPDFLYSENENAYSVAIKVLKNYKEDSIRYAKQAPEAVSKLIVKIKTLNDEILPILYKATSDYAISNKNKTLLTAINNERAQLEAENKKESKAQLNPNRNSLFQELKDAEEQLKELRLNHEKNRGMIVSGGAKGDDERMNKAYTLTKK